jgi:hypothetical protein
MVDRIFFFFNIHNLENFLSVSQLFFGNAMQMFVIDFKFGENRYEVSSVYELVRFQGISMKLLGPLPEPWKRHVQVRDPESQASLA